MSTVTLDSLLWIKVELDKTLERARQFLDAFAEEPEQRDLLARVIERLHQIGGTLQMVEVRGGVLLIEHMEALAKAIYQKNRPATRETLEPLMRATFEIGDYLERLVSGMRDSPTALLPIINELRYQLGQEPLAQEHIRHVRPPARSMKGKSASDLVALTARLRPRFQQALLRYYQGQNGAQPLGQMRRIMDELERAASSPAVFEFLWVANGLLEALLEEGLKPTLLVKRLLGQVERELKRVASSSEAAVAEKPPTALVENLLSQLEESKSQGERVTAIRTNFRLGEVSRESEPEELQEWKDSSNTALLRSVGNAIKDDLNRVRDRIDLFVRSVQSDPKDLRPVDDALKKIADALGMLELTDAKAALNTQRQTLQEIIGNSEAEEGSGSGNEEARLMNLATELIDIESGIDELLLGAGEDPLTGAIRAARIASLREALADIARLKDMVGEFIRSSGASSGLANAPLISVRLGKVLRFLDLPLPSALIGRVALYLLQMHRAGTVPDQHTLDRLADAVVSIEYYLETLQRGRTPPESMLENADRALKMLGVEQDVDLEELARLGTSQDGPRSVSTDAGDSASYTRASTADAAPTEEPVPEAPETGPADTSLPEVSGILTVESHVPEPDELPPVREAGADPDIVDIFIEEAGEVRDTLERYYPRWRELPSDQEALVTVRRAFHTLKGSGRMVGASLLGEFAWAFENLLNRVIDHTLDSHASIVGLVGEAVHHLPALVAQFASDQPLDFDVAPLIYKAKLYASGRFPADTEAEVEESVSGDLERDGTESDFHHAAGANEPGTPSGVATEPELAEVSELSEFARDEPSMAQEADEARPRIDATLLGIYAKETQGHLAELWRWLDQMATGECDDITTAVLRAAHTLTGSARMANINEVVALVAPFDHILRLLNEGERPPAPYTSLFRETLQAVDALVAAYGDDREPLPDCADLQDRLDRLSGELQEELETSTSAKTETPTQDTEWNSLEPDRGNDVVGQESLLSDDSGETIAQERDDVADMPDGADADRGENMLDEAEDGGAANQSHDGLHETASSEAFDEADANHETVTAGGEAQEAAPERQDATEQSTDVIDETSPGDGQPTSYYASSSLSVTSVSHGETGARDEAGKGELETFFDLNEMPGFDSGLADVFYGEAGELLEQADSALQVWQANHDFTDPLMDLQRLLHTLKGGARMAGVAPLADLSHQMEALLTRVADGRIAVSSDLIHLCQRAVDRMHRILEHAMGTGRVPVDPSVIDALKEVTGAGDAIRIPESRGEESASDDVDNQVGAQDEKQPAGPTDDGPAPYLEASQSAQEMHSLEEAALANREDDRRETPRLRHEMVRVRADLLESSINNAGEISIYRARIEQQLANMRVQLSELDRTVERVRGQLRELEIETEAQILSNYEQEPNAHLSDFDPLEMDRYTRIHELSRSLAEAVSDLNSLRSLLGTEVRQADVLLERQGRMNTLLQDALLRTRMVPFSLSAGRLRRTVRQVAEAEGREAQFSMFGIQGELDRQVLEHILPAVEHLLRNAVVHGIEERRIREQRGKPDVGQIELTLRREGADIVVEVADDGGGLDLKAIRSKAEKKGLISADDALTDQEIAQLIFNQGFSTAQEVTQTAGRGIGMDVVAAEARQLGGTVEIESRPFEGTLCRMRLPVTLAITQTLIIRAGNVRYPVPLSSIHGVARLPRAQVMEMLADERPSYWYGGQEYQVLPLERLLGEELTTNQDETPRMPLLLVEVGDRRLALVADDMEGSREVVVKSAGPQVSSIPGIAGATIFGDGSIGMILDLTALVRSLSDSVDFGQTVASNDADAGLSIPDTISVMVVDDSITVRRVTERLLGRRGVRVLTAKDGVEALELLQDHIPDVMLLDIEMPRMDGYELAGHIKNDQRLRKIPIIMITSRTGEKHRSRAAQIGIERYLGKPYHESELLEAIKSLVSSFDPERTRWDI